MLRNVDAGARPGEPAADRGGQQFGDTGLPLRRREVGFAERGRHGQAPAAGALARHCSPHPSGFAVTKGGMDGGSGPPGSTSTPPTTRGAFASCTWEACRA